MTKDFSMEQKIDILIESAARLEERLFVFQEQVNAHFDAVDERFIGIEQRLDYHEAWLNRIEINIATKLQMGRLLNILEKNNVISKYDTTQVMYIEPVV